MTTDSRRGPAGGLIQFWTFAELRCVLVVTGSEPRYAVALTEDDLTPINLQAVESPDEADIVAQRLWRTFVIPALTALGLVPAAVS